MALGCQLLFQDELKDLEHSYLDEEFSVQEKLWEQYRCCGLYLDKQVPIFIECP